MCRICGYRYGLTCSGLPNSTPLAGIGSNSDKRNQNRLGLAQGVMATFTGSEAASNRTLESGPGLRSGPGPLRKRLGEIRGVQVKCDHFVKATSLSPLMLPSWYYPTVLPCSAVRR